jgi:hypothetical protein
MLCIPAYTASFTYLKSHDCCTWFAGSGKDRRTGALKAHHTPQDANNRAGAARFGCKQSKRNLVVPAASNAADGVPVKEVSQLANTIQRVFWRWLMHAWLGIDQVVGLHVLRASGYLNDAYP